MKISIIIPVYNAAAHIGRCLKSVVAQTYEGPLECIMVDDVTRDNSMEIVKELLASYAGKIEFRIVSHDVNKGTAAARNTGIRISSGEYIYFLDSDDEIVPECIEILADLASSYPGVDIIQGNLVVTDELFRAYDLSNYNFPRFASDRGWIVRHMLTDIPVTIWNKLIRRQLIIDQSLWFKEGLIQEDLYWRYLSYRKIASIAFSFLPTYIYYNTPNSITNARYKDAYFHSLMSIYREHLAEAPTLRQYRNDLSHALNLLERASDFVNPEECREDFRRLLSEQLKSSAVPLMAKLTLWQLLHPSPPLDAVCWVYDRLYYRYMKLFC